MKVVRHRMITTLRTSTPLAVVGLLTSLLLSSSCNVTEIQGKTTKSGQLGGSNAAGKAYVYRESPYFIAGPNFSPENPNMATLIDKKTPATITGNTQLTSDCTIDFQFGTFQSQIASCIRSLSNRKNLQLLPRKEDRTWVFDPGSTEFYQVNALFHANQGLESFLTKLSFAYDRVNSLPMSVPRSIPPYLKTSQAFWLKGISDIDNKLLRNGYLSIFAQCDEANGAYVSPVGPEICLGYVDGFKNFWIVQDPSVLIHELGHVFVTVLLNLRNSTATSSHTLRSNMVSAGWEESSAINEGIADYFSFVNNRRYFIGEWVLGKGFQQARPLREDDPMHIEGLDVTPEGRLSYPQFQHYDPNNPGVIVEDVHYGGQTTTHYLVALTDSLKRYCTIEEDAHDEATSYVSLVLAETLAEVGDLNAKGIDEYWFGSPFLSDIYFNNMDPVNSFYWAHSYTSPTYRRFFQVFAKNINKFITGTIATGPGLCPLFTKDHSEKLLDDYGLLLFKTYNDNGNSTSDRTVTFSHAVPTIPIQPLTTVDETNRRKSVLISKELISLNKKTDTNPSAVSFYTIDDRAGMQGLLSNLLFKGYTVPLSSNVASIDYNNGNIHISPGEILAIVPNLYNGSNSIMAGVQLFANDWDHVHITDQNTGYFKPCKLDDTTTVDEGAEAASSCDPNNGYPDKEYKRLIKDPNTGLFPANAVAPVCMVLLEEDDKTRWVSQSEFRKKQGLALQDKDCLGYSASGSIGDDFSFNPHECLVRFLPGATESAFSLINPQSNYFDSVVKVSESKIFNPGNLLFMEVNKWIPPGTKFRCRLRARFSNCSNCFHDAANGNDDYLDSDYNGNKPFQIINLDFDVND